MTTILRLFLYFGSAPHCLVVAISLYLSLSFLCVSGRAYSVFKLGGMGDQVNSGNALYKSAVCPSLPRRC